MGCKMYDKIVILAPYKKLADISREVVRKIGLSIEVAEVNWIDAIETARKYKRLKKEIIISRGGIAKRIKLETGLSVIDINITGYDVLRSLYKYREYNKPIAVVENELFTKGAKILGDILGLDIRSYKVDKIENFPDKINQAINDGIELLIGGSWGVDDKEYIKSKGVQYELIESEEFSVFEAIQKACKLYEMTLEEREKKEMLKTVLDFSVEGIVSVDKNGKITTFNPSAEKIFRLNESDILGEKIGDVILGTKIPRVLETGEIEIGKIQNVGDFKIVTNRVPILINNEIMGAVATFQKVSDVQEIEQKVRYKLARRGLTAKYTFHRISGKSEKIKGIIGMAKIYSNMSSTVLISGETGTGKEVFAQAIHNESDRKNNAFVAVNCSALPGNLLESELFGYAEGAFTGARKGGKYGLFELAHNGTIFLDEIGEMEKTMQSRLLRVIQEREIMRIGDDKIIPIDVRIIAATNRDLYSEVEKGNFRADLYYRLNVLNIHIPPLRERKEDIECLVLELLQKLNKRLKCIVTDLDSRILKLLEEYHWPGNIRELQNVLEKIVVISKSGVAKFDDVEFVLNQLQRKNDYSNEDGVYNLTIEEIEKKVILRVLEEEKYNKSKTAQRLGINRSTLNRKLNKYV